MHCINWRLNLVVPGDQISDTYSFGFLRKSSRSAEDVRAGRGEAENGHFQKHFLSDCCSL